MNATKRQGSPEAPSIGREGTNAHIDSKDESPMQAVTRESSYRPVILTDEHQCSHSVLTTPIFDESEGLIYRIELWTEDDQHVDALLAQRARIAVGYGAL